MHIFFGFVFVFVCCCCFCLFSFLFVLFVCLFVCLLFFFYNVTSLFVQYNRNKIIIHTIPLGHSQIPLVLMIILFAFRPVAMKRWKKIVSWLGLIDMYVVIELEIVYAHTHTDTCASTYTYIPKYMRTHIHT